MGENSPNLVTLMQEHVRTRRIEMSEGTKNIHEILAVQEARCCKTEFPFTTDSMQKSPSSQETYMHCRLTLI
jgi:hypothetical protein